MKKALIIIAFGFFGIIFGFLFPIYFSMFIDFLMNRGPGYGHLSEDEASEWLFWYLVISGTAFSILWGWVGYVGASSWRRAFLMMASIIILSCIFLLLIPYESPYMKQLHEFIIVLCGWGFVCFLGAVAVHRFTRTK